MTCAILLIDMDAFYASVEQARHPELVGLPVIVGGSAESRGVVSTASYEARALGVRTAMPTAQAQRLCPQATFLPVDMKAYVAVSKQLLELFGRFTDLVEKLPHTGSPSPGSRRRRRGRHDLLVGRGCWRAATSPS